MARLTKSELAQIKDLVDYFSDNRDEIARFGNQLFDWLRTSASLKPYIHFIKYRVKDADHLSEKLARNALPLEVARSEHGKFGCQFSASFGD